MIASILLLQKTFYNRWFRDAIVSFLNENKVQYFHSKVGLNDIFAEGASTDYLMKKYQMNFESIYKTSIDLIK